MVSMQYGFNDCTVSRNFPQESLLTKLHIEVSQHVSTDISIVHLLPYVSFAKLSMKATYLKYKGNLVMTTTNFLYSEANIHRTVLCMYACLSCIYL